MAGCLGPALGPVLGYSPALLLFPAQELNTPSSWAGYLGGPSAPLQFHGNGTLQVTGTGCPDKSGCACGNALVSLPFPVLGPPVQFVGQGLTLPCSPLGWPPHLRRPAQGTREAVPRASVPEPSAAPWPLLWGLW